MKQLLSSNVDFKLTFLAKIVRSFTVILRKVFTPAADRIWPNLRNILVSRTTTSSDLAWQGQGSLRGNHLKVSHMLLVPGKKWYYSQMSLFIFAFMCSRGEGRLISCVMVQCITYVCRSTESQGQFVCSRYLLEPQSSHTACYSAVEGALSSCTPHTPLEWTVSLHHRHLQSLKRQLQQLRLWFITSVGRSTQILYLSTNAMV